MALHRYKVHETRATVDMTTPATLSLPHVRRNWKLEKIQAAKRMDIERENSLLVARMRGILNGETAKFAPYKKGSLNFKVRKQHHIRIVRENRKMARRLCQSKPVYSRTVVPSVMRHVPVLNLRSAAARHMPSVLESTVSAASTPRMLAASTQPREELVRDVIKCRGKYLIAAIKQPLVLPDLWDVEFYVPEDAVTRVTQLPIDTAAEWLGVRDPAVLRRRDAYSRDLLRKLLRCYEFGGGEDTAFDAANTTIALARPVEDVQVAECDVKSASPSAVHWAAAEEPHSPRLLKPARAVQLGLKKAMSGVPPEAFFLRRADASRGWLRTDVFKRLVRVECRVSPLDATDAQLDALVALLSDGRGIPVHTLVAFTARGLASSSERASDDDERSMALSSEITVPTFHTPVTPVTSVMTPIPPADRPAKKSPFRRPMAAVVAPYNAPPTTLELKTAPKRRQSSTDGASTTKTPRTTTSEQEQRPPPSMPCYRATRVATDPTGAQHRLALNLRCRPDAAGLAVHITAACASTGYTFSRDLTECVVLELLQPDVRRGYEAARAQGRSHSEAFSKDCADCIFAYVLHALCVPNVPPQVGSHRARRRRCAVLELRLSLRAFLALERTPYGLLEITTSRQQFFHANTTGEPLLSRQRRPCCFVTLLSL